MADENDQVREFVLQIVEDAAEKLGPDMLIVFSLGGTPPLLNNPLDNAKDHINGKTDD